MFMVWAKGFRIIMGSEVRNAVPKRADGGLTDVREGVLRNQTSMESVT